jgi:hypothetical protein
MWVIKTEDRRECGGTVELDLESEDGKFDVNVKWDGYMEIHVYSLSLNIFHNNKRPYIF